MAECTSNTYYGFKKNEEKKDVTPPEMGWRWRFNG